MGVEIERKFLIIKDKLPTLKNGINIRQAYIANSPERNVRVRTKGEKAFLTIKTKGKGIRRKEFEYEIPYTDAEELFKICEGKIIDKTRYELHLDGLLWELDVFHGVHQGLILAEVELESEDQQIEIPNWIGQEVSTDPRYYNASLAKE
jgi:adenylate cyclase